MSVKKTKKSKKKVKQNLSQKERFIEYARETECDESGETFEKAMSQIFPRKDKAKL